ncbi:hypothetical protein QBZ16_003919 [Prototheca wickerhamii]|uniref:phosphoribosylanthranilate isomerase n=1 Tax=Prototheca wickerhamii TaxID=3111 RepID=A0AAD9IGM3_PROWI|nr:hypothetical protein QBZ16_003919 [Prototheca wickerhamii]
MSAADAQHAAEAGANLIGMIMFPRAKRALTVEQAKRVAEAARAHGAEPVGVFVDEDAETIVRTAREADLKIVQLHGPASQASLASIPADVGVVFVVTITPDGSLSAPIPDPLPRPVDLFIIDAAKVPGESLKLDWSALPPRGLPAGAAWLLAGGLTADNVRGWCG